MELEELYPPRFVIDVSGTEARKSGHLWIEFSGMTTEFKSELILERQGKLHTCRDFLYEQDNMYNIIVTSLIIIMVLIQK